jgi:PAS domain S-box-containing protein
MEKLLRILMLEDSPDDAEIVHRLLVKEKRDFEFRLAMNKQEYLLAFDNFDPDIILSDNSLPQFNGREALDIALEFRPHIPFILVTGTVSEEYAVDIIKSGASDYVLKDRLARLPAAIDTALKQRRAEEEKLDAMKRLKESEEKYRSLVERVSDGFMALDVDWRFIYLNKKAEQLYNRSPGYLLGKNMWAEFPETVDKPFYKAYYKAMETQENIHLEEYSFAVENWIEANIYPSPSGVSVYFRDLTDQRKAELLAKKSEERYKVFLERITDAFIALDKDWCYTYINKQAGELIRRDPASMIGKNVWDEFPEAIGSATYDAFHKAIKEQRFVLNTDYFEPLDLWQENHIYPSPDGLSVFIKDITAQKKAEEQQALLASIVNSSEDAIISKNLDGIISSWNPGAERLFGYSASEVLNKNISLLIPSNRLHEEPEIIEKIRKGAHVDHYETQRVKKDGRKVDISLTISPIRNINNKIIGASKIARDITEQKNAEKQKEFDRNNLSALINNTADLMWSVDKDLKLITFNDSFDRVIKPTSGQSLGKGGDILTAQFTEDQLKRYKIFYERALSGEIFTIIDHFEYPVELWSEISFYPIRIPNQIIGTACFSRDITERKKTEKAMYEMEQQILNQRVQEQKKITRAIINAQETERNYIGQELHDNISQILASTKLFLGIAGSRDEATKEFIKYPTELIDNSIQEIRSLSSRLVTPLKNVDLHELIQLQLDRLKENTNIRTILVYNVKGRAIDDNLKLNIYRIVQEQLNNIQKYAAPKNIGISIVAAKKVLSLELGDDGKGFDINKKRKGIGISNMMNRIESFNGEMRIESSPGKGCKIRITIPY